MLKSLGARIHDWLERGMKEHPLRTSLIWLAGSAGGLAALALMVMVLLASIIPSGTSAPERIAVKGYFHDEKGIFTFEDEKEKLIRFLETFEEQTGVRILIATRRYEERDRKPELVAQFARKVVFADKPPKRWVLAHYQVEWNYIFMGIGGDRELVSKLSKEAIDKITYNCRGSDSRCFIQKGADHTVRLLVQELRLVLTGSRFDPTKPVAN